MAHPPRPSPPKSFSKFTVEESKEFSHLRHLLLAPERLELEHLKKRLAHFTLQPQDVSRVLPDAIRLRASQDTRLLASMVPVTQEALSLSIKQSPELISDSIAPILGPAIRKAIVRAMRGMVDSLNHMLEYSMSWKGLQWRWEAFRTGKPFAEVVLLHTLRFRVEQVFLIHKKTGLLLNHVVAEGVTGHGEEVISGMLTAIQDFVRDSFGTTNEEGLDSLRIGDLTVWIEQGKEAILAGVIRGAPPIELREVFQESLETIHANFSEALQSFRGDASSFQDTHLPLEDCLQAQFVKKPGGSSWAVWVVVGVLLIGVGMWALQVYFERQRWTQLVERVGQEPGVMVTSVQENEGTVVFYGFQDPMANDPNRILSEFGYTPQQVVFRLTPFLDLTPEFVHKRAMVQLRPLNSVVISLEGQTLILAGEAPHAWIQQTQLVGPLLPGVTQIETGQLIDTDVKQFETLKAKLESDIITFEVGISNIGPDQRSAVLDIAQTMQALDQKALVLDRTLQILIQGFSSPGGGKEINQTLSVRRAHATLNALSDRQFRAINLRPVGMGSASSRIMSIPRGRVASHGGHVGFQVVDAQVHGYGNRT